MVRDGRDDVPDGLRFSDRILEVIDIDILSGGSIKEESDSTWMNGQEVPS
jgi:hypothetical protein